MRIDPTNLKIIERLQNDARTSVAELARDVGRAESTVRERYQALQHQGILKGFHADIDLRGVGLQAQGIVTADCDRSEIGAVRRRLAAVPHVTRVLLTTGPSPLRIEVVAEDIETLESVVEERLATIGLRSLDLEVVVRELMPDRPAPVAALLARRDGGDVERGRRARRLVGADVPEDTEVETALAQGITRG